MVTEQRQDRTEVEFRGSAEERELAQRVLDLARGRGRFMSAGAPIRFSISSLLEFFRSHDDEPAAARLEAAMASNPQVFRVEEIDGERLIVTTLGGRIPDEGPRASTHSFVARFVTPLPKPETPPQPVRERARIDPSWAKLPAILADFADEEELDPEMDSAPIDEAVVTAAPALTDETSATPIDDVVPTVAAVEPPTVETAAAAQVVEVEMPAAVVEPPPAMAPADEDLPVAATVSEPIAPEAIEAFATPEVVSPAPAMPTGRTMTLPVVAPTDVSGVDDLALAGLIRPRLQADPRVANFGEQWMMEDRVPRFSRGDLRRFKEYIQEQEQPLPDDVLVQDVLGVRPGTPDFGVLRFAVNFRLSREHREFEFVGTSNQRFWSTTGLPQIGTTRRKPNEIGSDYRYLLEESPAEPTHRGVPSIDRVLSFYEYQHGLLPYDADMQALLPGPVVPNQKTAVLTFESPQSYTTYLVELRYPTPNRGGFILGLDDLFAENLVPGAVLSIGATENDGHYLVEYLAESGQNARLLELDERRAQRYVFRPTTYACAVDESMLLNEDRFGRLNGEKPLDEKVRRRPEAVLATTFERVGDNRDANFWADFPTLLAGVNVERPVSATLLRRILENDDTGAFSPDPDKSDAYTYVPGTTP